MADVPYWLTLLCVEDRGKLVLAPHVMNALDHSEKAAPDITVANWKAWLARLTRRSQRSRVYDA